MRVPIKVRLSSIMFFQYFVQGATVPIMSLYLKKYLGFSGAHAGIILSTSSVASFVSPLLSSLVADKLVSTERLYTVLHVVAACVMFLLALQHSFIGVFFLYMLYMTILIPTVSLSNSMAFHHISDATRSFGGIRVWGTTGWVVVALLFGFLWIRQGGGHLSDALFLAAGAGILLSILSLSIPVVEHEKRQRQTIIPKASIQVMRRPQVVVLSIVGFVAAFVDRYYYFGASPFLDQIGFSESIIMPAMSIGQVTEIVSMALLSIFLYRFGFKAVLASGLVMQIVRFTVLLIASLYPSAIGIAIAGLGCHGFTFSFFFVTAFIFLDNCSNPEARTGVQQLFSMVSMGLGGFAGYIISGEIMDLFSRADGSVIFQGFWAVPVGISFLGLLILILFFTSSSTTRET